MKNFIYCLCMVIALCLVAGAAEAQGACDECPMENSCVGMVYGPKQGVHSRFEGGVDAVLWPPNHKTREVRISAMNACGRNCDVTISTVQQDEPVNGAGDGNTSPDAEACDNSGNMSTVRLRGERSGGGPALPAGQGEYGTGRFYTVGYTMTDPCWAVDSVDTASILVPHDQGVAHIDTWIDEGPIYDSDEGAPGMACSN